MSDDLDEALKKLQDAEKEIKRLKKELQACSACGSHLTVEVSGDVETYVCKKCQAQNRKNERDVERLKAKVAKRIKREEDDAKRVVELQGRIEELEGAHASLAAANVRNETHRKRIKELERQLTKVEGLEE